MHVVIINGSPRIRKHSNTEKIIDAFASGLGDAGASCERYAVSDRSSWDTIREAYEKNTEIVIALPLYVECVPGLLLEFLETLPAKNKGTRISFVLQGGFAEASQLKCGEEFLRTLPDYLGTSYGGTLIKGDNFGIRVSGKEVVEKLTSPYREIGTAFVKENGFLPDTVKKFAGLEFFPYYTRVLLQIMFMTIAKKRYNEVAKQWGCKVPIDYKPWT